MRKFTGNLLFAFLAQAISTCSSIIISLVLPKMLGVEGFAYWQLFIFYSGYVGFFHFGLSDGLYLRYGGQTLEKMDKNLIGSQFRFMVIWQMMISIIASFVVLLLVEDTIRLYIWRITLVYLVTANMAWCLGYIFQAANETRLYSISIMISKLLFIVYVGYTFIIHKYNLKNFLLVYLGAQIAALFYSIIVGRQFVFSRWIALKTLLSETTQNMKIGISLTVSNIAGSLILGMGKAFVDGHWDIKTFGVFSLALSLTNFILQFIQQISMVMFPALRQVDSDQRDNIYQVLRGTVGLIFCGILILYVPLKQILSIWLPQYEKSFEYLAIVLPICIFDGKMQMLYTTYLKVLRKEKSLLWINIFSCLLSYLLCLLSAKIFNSVFMIVCAMMIVIFIRSIIASCYLSGLMKINFEKNIVIEGILSLSFIVLNILCTPFVAFVIYLLLFGLCIKSCEH